MGHVRDIATDTVQAILARLTGAPASAADVQSALAERT